MNFKLPNTAILFAVLFLLFGLINFQASAAVTTVTICHATASATNPYIKETIAIASLGNGHGTNGINKGDIVPPTPGTDFPNGNNWNSTGQAIYNNNCKIPSPTPTPTIGGGPTLTPTPTSTPTPTPTIGEGPTLTPTPTLSEGPTPTPTIVPGLGGNDCTIVTLVNSSSKTGNNTTNNNTGGDTSITTGNTTANTTVNTNCGINIANIHFSGNPSNAINISNNGAGSNNAVEVTSNQIIKVFQ